MHGDLYVGVGFHNTVVRVAPDGSLDTVATAADGLNQPSTVTFGAGRRSSQALAGDTTGGCVGTEVKLDAGGRMVIPAPLRRRLGIPDGGVVVVEDDVDGVTIRRPDPERSSPTTDERGLVVLDPGRAVDVDDTLAAITADRDHRG